MGVILFSCKDPRKGGKFHNSEIAYRVKTTFDDQNEVVTCRMAADDKDKK